MCFQGYVHWLCKHTSLYEESCPAALALNLPFHLKVSCPAYTISIRSPPRYCGTGHFYCAQTPEGIELEHLHAAHASAKEEISRIEELVYGDEGLRAYGQGIGNAILRNGGAREECERDEGIRGVFEEVGRLNGEVHELRVRERKLVGMIERAQVHFGQKVVHHAGMGRMAPGLYPPTLERRSRTLVGLDDGRERGGELSVGHYQTGQHNTRLQHHQYQHDQYQVQQHQHGPSEIESYQAGTHLTGNFEECQIGQHQSIFDRPGTGTDRKRYTLQNIPLDGPSHKKLKKEPSPYKPSPPVRRSSRVHTKKVAYAESESDAFSRTPSPEKSDAADSTFSPSRQITSNKKVQIGRSSSLVDKIGDWQKREMTKTFCEPLNYTFPEHTSNTSSVLKPETRESNFTRYDVDARLPKQNPAGHVNQEWKVNTLDADFAIPSPINRLGAPQKSIENASLRQKFSSTPNLATVPRKPTELEDFEPRKRRLGAPLPPPVSFTSSKRLKVSFPGDGDADSHLLAGHHSSAPVGTPRASRDAVGVEDEEDEQEGDEQVPLQARELVSVSIDAEAEDPDVEREEEQMEEKEVESELSEIDWDVLEEDTQA